MQPFTTAKGNKTTHSRVPIYVYHKPNRQPVMTLQSPVVLDDNNKTRSVRPKSIGTRIVLYY